MKAWYVYRAFDEGGEQEADIVHAENRTSAKRRAYSLPFFDVDNWVTDIGARRVPELDDKPITDLAYLAHGFGVECEKCSVYVYGLEDCVIAFGKIYCVECGESILKDEYVEALYAKEDPS